MTPRNLALAAVALSALGIARAAPPAPPELKFSALRLPGGEAGIGFDDLIFAPSLRRVLAPGGRTGNLALVDPDSQTMTAIGGFSMEPKYVEGHGVGVTSADEGRGLLFVTDRTARRLDVVEPKGGGIVSAAALAGVPDYVRYVAPTGEVWVTEPGSKRVEIFTIPAGSNPTPLHVAFIEVPGGPESLVIDATRRRAYTHLWKDTTISIDLDKRAIVARWKNGCSDSRGIALDEKRGLLFVGCDEGKAAALDVEHSGKQVGTAVTGKGVDVIAYSSSLAHLYVPGEDSKTLTVLGVGPTGVLTALATAPTATGAHCVAADDRRNIYICDPGRGQLLIFKDVLSAAAAR